jgi:hypothetical protein
MSFTVTFSEPTFATNKTLAYQRGMTDGFRQCKHVSYLNNEQIYKYSKEWKGWARGFHEAIKIEEWKGRK